MNGAFLSLNELIIRLRASCLAMKLHGGPDALFRYYRGEVKYDMSQAEADSTPETRQENLQKAREFANKDTEFHSSLFRTLPER